MELLSAFPEEEISLQVSDADAVMYNKMVENLKEANCNFLVKWNHLEEKINIISDHNCLCSSGKEFHMGQQLLVKSWAVCFGK